MLSEFIIQIVALTNIERAKAGLQPLTLNSQLVATAQGHSEDMAINDFFSHTGLDGDRLSDRAKQNNYDYRALGENIAVGQRTPEQVVQAWLASPGHRKNILNPNFAEIGIGYKFLRNDRGSINFNHYWTQVFGKPISTNNINTNSNSNTNVLPFNVFEFNTSGSNDPNINVYETHDFGNAELSGNGGANDSLNSPIFRFQNSAQPANYLFLTYSHG